jgi:hypothetical protein
MAGSVMAHRSSNRRRNACAVSLLDVQRHDRVLEIGFGPGSRSASWPASPQAAMCAGSTTGPPLFDQGNIYDGHARRD